MSVEARSRPFAKIAALFLAVVCIAHILRAVMALPVTVGTHEIPSWMSLPGALFTGALAVLLFMESRKP